MTTPFDLLSDDELQELNHFMLVEVKSDDAMTMDMLDGYLHAIAIGPVTLMPSQWMPAIWGEGKSMMPEMAAQQQDRKSA